MTISKDLNTLLMHAPLVFNYLPIGSLYLADALEQEEIYTELLQSNISHEELGEKIEKIKPTAIGMSVITSPDIKDFVDHSKFIKENFPNLPIIWGGVHPSINPIQCSEESFIDYVITGQAESTLPNMVKSIGRGENLEKTTISEPIANLDKYSPQWDKIDISKCVFPEEHSVHGKARLKENEGQERTKNIFYYLVTSRGCVYNCTFCSENREGEWRDHSSEWVKKEINNIEKKLQEKDIKLGGVGFWDDMFWINKKRAEEILNFIKKKDLGYLIESRADNLLKNDARLLKRLKDTGCMQVFVGAESADQTTLDYIKKQTKVEDYYKLIDLVYQNEIPLRFSMIIGFPEETDVSVNKTLDFVEFIRQERNEYVSISGPKLFTPYPGTIEFQRAVERGFVVPKTTIEWGGVSRKTEDYRTRFPWLKENLSSSTLKRMELVLKEEK